jgi:hypothetical protein
MSCCEITGNGAGDGGIRSSWFHGQVGQNLLLRAQHMLVDLTVRLCAVVVYIFAPKIRRVDLLELHLSMLECR